MVEKMTVSVAHWVGYPTFIVLTFSVHDHMQPLIHRSRVVLIHLSFWCVYLSFFIYQVMSHQRAPDIDWLTILTVVGVQLIFALIISYTNYFILLPAFLKDKKLGRYLLQFLVIFATIITLRLWIGRYLFDGFAGGNGYLYTTRYTIQVVTTNLFIVIFLGMIRFAVDWFEFEARQKNVENERLTAELNFLKAQINPHFLFNTLNNLYYLAYTQSANTTEVIAKLSQMMRYMIYESNHPLVPLSKEIEYMENYISLERLRLNDQIPIKLTIEGGNPQGLLITPLIFITFLENAFKHGVSNNRPQSWVSIRIQIREKECVYRVENSKIPFSKPEAEQKSGIGLQNVKRRLELSYPEKHSLTVEDLKDRYSVQLTIQLA
ncbi:MAG: sensor histidine kinase [Chryseosolibacter sp.]